ncbi:MAG TPA: hypothetical protein VMG11_03675 [Steroidobacteraceae bacterium]|nr:hypothetical protein [Steroidobacteraceae bacterium]
MAAGSLWTQDLEVWLDRGKSRFGAQEFAAYCCDEYRNHLIYKYKKRVKTEVKNLDGYVARD